MLKYRQAETEMPNQSSGIQVGLGTWKTWREVKPVLALWIVYPARRCQLDGQWLPGCGKTVSSRQWPRWCLGTGRSLINWQRRAWYDGSVHREERDWELGLVRGHAWGILSFLVSLEGKLNDSRHSFIVNHSYLQNRIQWLLHNSRAPNIL